ncbi:MAG TPA: META domain-containing protein [Chitinophagaceae bacterium]|nr:META domain-containing protein [Chitinophagaceae bacterium]
MKKNILLSMMTLAVVLFIVSCGVSSKITKNNPDGAHNSRNSLDWNGVYKGVLPCADCPGIRTTIQLTEDGHYKEETKYLGRNDSGAFNESGTFSWYDAGGKIRLANGDQYMVGENKLIRLNQDGLKVKGSLADHYILSKLNGKVTETYWKLVSLNGEKVVVDSSFNREPYLILKEKDNKVSGNAGCNQIMGSYTLKEGDKIEFSQMASTMMACPNLDSERAFLDAIEKVDQYSLNGEELVLKSEGQPVATFKAVYFH